MVRKHLELPPRGLTISYLNLGDLRTGMPFAEKFAYTPERRAALKRIMEQKYVQQLIIALEGHPVAFVAAKTYRLSAEIIFSEQLMMGVLDDSMIGRLADFLGVEWMTHRFESMALAQDWGERWGMVGYEADMRLPENRTPLQLTKKDDHLESGLRFGYLNPTSLRGLGKGAFEAVKELMVQGILDEVPHDSLNIHFRAMLQECGGDVEATVKKILKNNRYRIAVAWHVGDRKIAAAVAMHSIDPFVGKEHCVNGIVVDKEYRGRGYAALLLTYAMSRLDHRATILKADSFYANTPSRALFESHPGFSLTTVERAQSRLINGYYRRTGAKETERFFSDEVPA